MSGAAWHIVFDILAWAVAALALIVLRRGWFRTHAVPEPLRFGYTAAVLFGAGMGAWAFGTANLWLSGIHEAGRSVEGALAGAILAVELYKRANGIEGRTGAIYALPLALGVAVGRIGCLLAGLQDHTHGIATGGSWGWDFGDGIARHPVQLYECLTMGAFGLFYTLMMMRGSNWWRVNGFYAAVMVYGAQRFAWEFLKPYDTALAGLTLFQHLSLALMLYGAVMLERKAIRT